MKFVPVHSTRLGRDGTPRVDLDLAFITLHARFYDPHLKAEAPLPEHFWAIHRFDGTRSEPVAKSSTCDAADGGCSFTRKQIEELGSSKRRIGPGGRRSARLARREEGACRGM